MGYSSIAISSGHSKYVAGACALIEEVPEARRVVDQVAAVLATMGVYCCAFHDNTSKTQSENLNTIVSWHNAQQRELDVSVHFNAAQKPTDGALGVEVLYLTQEELAAEVSAAIAACGLKNRGPKPRNDLAFLNGTDMPAILIEVCFVNSTEDVSIYQSRFSDICDQIALTLAGLEIVAKPPAGARPIIAMAISVPDGVELSITVNGVGILLAGED